MTFVVVVVVIVVAAAIVVILVSYANVYDRTVLTKFESQLKTNDAKL